ncbi:hypothetical protein LQZ21_10525 [Treponema sp. TIM-1]|uniref:hypothetical protein n=1 Tax=Treponema sp. TIM-1 TaxID=2898417 RepID=UPI00397FABA8
MNEKELCVEMLIALWPKPWKRIVLTMILTGLAYRSFGGLALGIPVAAADLAMGILGLVTVIVVWIDFHVSRKVYHKYQNELIELTRIS